MNQHIILRFKDLLLLIMLLCCSLFVLGQENCFDGVDNDGDGLIDCLDGDCGTLTYHKNNLSSYTNGTIYNPTTGNVTSITITTNGNAPAQVVTGSFSFQGNTVSNVPMSGGSTAAVSSKTFTFSEPVTNPVLVFNSMGNSPNGQKTFNFPTNVIQLAGNVERNTPANITVPYSPGSSVASGGGGYSPVFDGVFLMYGTYTSITVTHTEGNDGWGMGVLLPSVCPVAENTIAKCTDGVDNDGDGLSDCSDPDCQALNSAFTNGGSISGDETSCGTFDPANMVSTAAPSGGTGSGVEYIWQYRLGTSGNWTNLANSNTSNYDQTPISTTHQFRRLARRVAPCNTTWAASNIVTKTVHSVPDLDQYTSVNGSGFALGNTVSLCDGGSVLLDMGGAFGSDWSFTFQRPDGTNFPGGTNGAQNDQINLPTVQDGSVNEGTWNVTYTDPNGCSNSESFTVNVHPIPDLDQYTSINDGTLTLGNNINVCDGSSVLLDMGGTFGNDWSFTFQRPDGTNFPGGTNGAQNDQINLPTVQDGSVNEGTWNVTYTDPNGCSNTESFTITTNNDYCDDDNDGVANINDLDKDNDGITDAVELATASNGGDTDGDGIPDNLDLDSDNDGINDVIEAGGSDTDGNGFADGTVNPTTGIPVSAGNGLTPTNSDSDNLPDFQDVDSDGDGVFDLAEIGLDFATIDTDNDGQIDLTTDTDGDGIQDPADGDLANYGDSGGGIIDTDGDGIPNTLDTDNDNDGITDIVELQTASNNGDTDGDGIPDHLDLDSDNDGINDVYEAGGTDTNGDGFADGTPNSTSGIPASAGNGLTPPDSDNDGLPNFQDLNSDNNGLPDLEEGGLDPNAVDSNNDGMVDAGADTDSDGIQDLADGDTANYGDSGDTPPVDTDNNGTPDTGDGDNDGDGQPDVTGKQPIGITGAGNQVGSGAGTVGGSVSSSSTTISNIQWYNGVNPIAGATNPTYCIMEAGVYYATYDGGECGSNATDYQVVVNNCDPTQSQVILDASAQSAPYQWYADGVLIAGETNATLTVTATSTSVEYYCEGNVCSRTASFHVYNLTHCDADNDGIVDVDDLDDDNDGIPDTVEMLTASNNGDTDGDGVLDQFDLDSDNDGINDVIEADGTDTNGDGFADGTPDPTTGIPATAGTGLTPTDTDNDNTPDFQDVDSDGDGVYDLAESGLDFPTIDTDNDGQIDPTADTDGDGIQDPADGDLANYGDANDPGEIDTDGDGIPNTQDLDNDNDGILDITELQTAVNNGDTDGDGVPDHLDLDSDNDGINDVYEAGGTDVNGDGFADGTPDPTTGIPASAGNGLTPPDSDNDGLPNFQDLDSDNNGMPDLVENGLDPAILDTNNDGMVDTGADTDGDGIQDLADGDTANYGDSGDTPPLDTDNDGTPDISDDDNDGDGQPDSTGKQPVSIAGTGTQVGSGAGTVGGTISNPSSNPITNIQWYNGNTPIPGETNSTYCITSPGVYYATYDGGECGNNATDYQVVVDNCDPTQSQVILDASAQGALYQWYADGVLMVGETNATLTVTATSTSVEYYSEGTACSKTASYHVFNLSHCDNDNDGIVDVDDLDDDNDGIPDTVEMLTAGNNGDTDGDGVPDLFDLDSDNDGINDVIEAGGTDTNGDGFADGTVGTTPTTNGIPSSAGTGLTPVDTDTDGNPDFQDLDADNDGISDLVESGQDPTLVDVNNDGVVNPSADLDGDGIQDDVDDNLNYGDANSPTPQDSDNDGIPDYQDLDSDDPTNTIGNGDDDVDDSGNSALDGNNDGQIDPTTDNDDDGIDDSVDNNNNVYGGLGGTDTDGDGIPDTQDLDDDNDGIPDTVEQATASNGGDTDGDGIPDDLDLDSDNDGINDVIEGGGTDANGDGIADGTIGTTLTTNGIPSSAGSGLVPPDSDTDGQPDFQDLDSDNDGVNDLIESGNTLLVDANNDGMVDGTDPDNDGILGVADGSPTYGDANDPTPQNTDSDNLPNYIDPDDDNDGINTIDEDTNGDGDQTNDDADGDGVPDYLDDDTFVRVTAKVFLQGSYDQYTGLMRDDLRNLSYLPTNEPYAGFGYSHTGGGGGETVLADKFNITGNDAIVDWVILELHDQVNPSTIIASRAALVQRDGDIVDMDGVSPVNFLARDIDNYYLAVKHRNHLGVMTDIPMAMGQDPIVVDFTSASQGNYQLLGAFGSNYPQKVYGGSTIRTLWAGNVDFNDRVIFQGTPVDHDGIFFGVLLDPGNTSLAANYIQDGYNRGDVNMDGTAIFQGSPNDTDIIFFNVVGHPENTGFLANFIIIQQIP